MATQSGIGVGPLTSLQMALRVFCCVCTKAVVIGTKRICPKFMSVHPSGQNQPKGSEPTPRLQRRKSSAPSYRARIRRWMTAKMNAVETPNINIPQAASNGPSSFHPGGNTMSELAVV
jgi:hypothetical protein